MEEALRALLLGTPAITALVDRRVNFGAHPQGEPLPALVLTTVSDREGLTLGGPDGLQQARVQIDCYAESYGATPAPSTTMPMPSSAGSRPSWPS
ncbi:DUF3168 domain-containing protein [Cereibacter sphaeroides]|uniref:DUF3168 domain-containing protein n=1 Tax=Cereibacter sphaeroides TaxID=1063 RepID=UPI0015591448|nr:DUF3168 domain-containing protein [Cereibacter sphaeroides]